MNTNRSFAVGTIFTAALAPLLAALVACGGSPSTASPASPRDDRPGAPDGSTSDGGAAIVVGSTGNPADAASEAAVDAGVLSSMTDGATDGMAESAAPEPLDSGIPPVACGNACTGGQICQGGACACPEGETTCGGQCVAESDDANNCGACGHGCLGGTCSGGQCQPIVLTTDYTDLATSITVDANNVYFGTQRGLYACAKSGCASSTQLNSIGTQTVLFEPEYGYLFVSRWDGQYFDEDTLSGSSNYTAAFSYPSGLAMDAQSVYVGFSGGIVAAYKGPSAFDSPRTIVDSVSDEITALAVDAAGGFVYGVGLGLQASILRAATTGTGSFQTYVTNQAGPYSIAVGGGNVFWTNLGTDANHLQDGAAYLCAEGASCPSPTPLGGGDYCTSVTVDDSRVYFDCNYTLYGCPLAGCGDGGPTALAATGVAGGGAATLANDATAIYWMSTDGTGLKKLAK
jgi:hypothetical protein